MKKVRILQHVIRIVSFSSLQRLCSWIIKLWLKCISSEEPTSPQRPIWIMGTMLLLMDFGTVWEWATPIFISYWFVIPQSTVASSSLVTQIVTSSVIAGATIQSPHTSVLHLTMSIINTLVWPLTSMAPEHSIKGSSVSVCAETFMNWAAWFPSYVCHT